MISRCTTDEVRESISPAMSRQNNAGSPWFNAGAFEKRFSVSNQGSRPVGTLVKPSIRTVRAVLGC
jgi:hypothetical protein